jgi:cytochrome P450
LGNLADLVRDPPGFLTACDRDFGDVVPLRFGPWRSVLVSDPDLIGQVLADHNDHLVKMRILRRNRLLFGNGLLVSDGETCRRHRRLIQPVFHRARVAAYTDLVIACAERQLAAWPDGEARDVHGEMSRLTLEIVAKTPFNADVGDKAADVGPALNVVMEIFVARLRSLFLAPERLPTPGNRRLQPRSGDSTPSSIG